MNAKRITEAYKYFNWDLACDVAPIKSAETKIKLTQVFKLGHKPLLDLREWDGNKPGAGFTLDMESAERLYNVLGKYFGKGVNE